MEPNCAYVEPRAAEVRTMTWALPLLFVLMLVPGIAFGQSAAAPGDAMSLPTVRASVVNVGLGTKLMQVASIAFNPKQRNTHWPLFAYPVSAVFSSRTCDSFASTPLEGEVAFVRPENPNGSIPSTFLGIRIRDTDLIRDVCQSSNRTETLQNLLPPGLERLSGDWYLLSERPLRHIESSYRTNLFPVDLGTDSGISPSLTVK